MQTLEGLKAALAARLGRRGKRGDGGDGGSSGNGGGGGAAPRSPPPPQQQQQQYAATIDDIRAAAERIKGAAKVTPVLTCSAIDALAHGRELFLKCETFQKGGAFKFRGACNAVRSLDAQAAARGVCTHSSGNHAAALALAARLRGVPAHIVVPRDAPRCKLDAVEEYGGRVVLCEPTMDEREAACAKIVAETGATFVPPYDYAPVIAGQGTLALELLEQAPPDLDAIVVPVSGGGLIAGVAIAAKALRPSIRVVAAEPRGANDAADAAASKARGERVALPKPATIADGLQARLGALTWPVIRDLVDAVVVLDDAEIVAAMRLLFERAKLVVEPSGAAALAAALSPAGSEALAGCQRVGIVLSGGNVDFGARGFWDSWSSAAS